MIDHLLDFIQSIDPIKWIDDAYTTSRNGRGALLEWDATSTTGADVETLLRTFGVKVYARKYPTRQEKIAGCHVPSAQAAYADGLLRGHGIPVVSAPLSKPIRPSRSWGVPAKAQGLAGKLGDAMGVAPRKERKERY